MPYITWDETRPLNIIPIGRIAIDFNPVDYFRTLDQCGTFKKYLGGSPANIGALQCAFAPVAQQDRASAS